MDNGPFIEAMFISMDWFKGKITGKPHIYWENPWFPADFPLNQSIDYQRLADEWYTSHCTSHWPLDVQDMIQFKTGFLP